MHMFGVLAQSRYERGKKAQCAFGKNSGALAHPPLRAFFSIDAAFAGLAALLSFSAFALLLSSSLSISLSQSREISGSLLAVRFSSFVLEEAALAPQKAGGGAYFFANELDAEKLRAMDLEEILQELGRGYASVRLEGGGGELFFSSAGIRGSETFCARRLAMISGGMALLEACIS